MRFAPSLLDDIRARLPVSSVVGKRVPLKKAGKEWKGLSPFNTEKTPSFYVNDQKGFYHCFSSGKHGDIFRFLMETEGVSFPEAVERLAAEAGVALPKEERQAREQEDYRASLYDICEMACLFFEKQLQGRAGGEARALLERRGLSEEMCRLFRIGWAGAERFALRDHLTGRGVTIEAMLEVGLLTKNDIGAVPWDRFRERLIFPIQDTRGHVIAFGGRAMRADMPAKYLNSPETELFHKGQCLYNLHRARKAAQEKSRVIAVEGYIDAIAVTGAGFSEVVAPLGTALTQEQLQILWRMADEPILCFDGDKAGLRAAFRALDVALPLLEPGRSLRVALLPNGQDPDDLIRSSGPVAFAKVLENARPLIDMLWMREAESAPRDTPERLAAFDRRLRAALETIRNETVRRYYREAIQERLAPQRAVQPSVFRNGARTEGYRTRERLGKPAQGPLKASPLLAGTALFAGTGQNSPREALIVTILRAHPDLLPPLAETLAGLDFRSHEAIRLRAILLDCAAGGSLPDEGSKSLVDHLRMRVHPADRWLLEKTINKERVLALLHQAMALHHKASALNQELRAAERALAEDESETNLAWLRHVQTELLSMEHAQAEGGDGV
jgi:DNA primase